jgi:hypothetical protein
MLYMHVANVMLVSTGARVQTHEQKEKERTDWASKNSNH